MARQSNPEDVVERLYQGLVGAPKQQRRLRSNTFWGDLKYKVRTQQRIELVSTLLRQRGIQVTPELGTEDRDDWLVFSFVKVPPPEAPPLPRQPVRIPNDEWFKTMSGRVFESEREVEMWLVIPLLEQLGYTELDFAVGYPVPMHEGSRRIVKEADVVVFNGPSREKEDALLVVEAKTSQKSTDKGAEYQARSYALWLSTPYYVVTNGDELKVFLFRGAVMPDQLRLACTRADMRQNWDALYQLLAKPSVVTYKEKISQSLARTAFGET